MSDFELPNGTMDIHVHTAPDVVERPLDDLELAAACLAAGMSGAVLKSHTEPTAGRAFLASRAVPGAEMFGGIVLNRSVGGLNPDAVEAMARGAGRRGRIVWLPTRDAAHERASKRRDGPTVPVTEHGRPVPGLDAIFEVVAAHDLVLATGHIAAGEALAVFRSAREAGCRRLLVTHATAPISNYSGVDLSEMIAVGAWIEFAARNLFGTGHEGQKVIDPAKVGRMVAAIRHVGPASSVFSSDLGDQRYPLPQDGFRMGAQALVQAGLTVDQMEGLLRTRPMEILAICEK